VSRTKSFIYNSATAALFQLCTVAAGFIVPRIILTVYGSEINGLVTSITQFIAYFNLVEAGLAGAAVYALYKPLADKDVAGINAILSAANRFYILSGYIFVSLTLGLALIYPNFVRTAHLTPFNVGLLVLILGVSGSLEFFTMAKYRALLTADQKQYVLSIASMVAIILNTLIIAILAYNHVNIVILRLVALFSVFARSLILYCYIRSKYKYINYRETPNNEALNKRWDALYWQILGAVQSGAPVIIATIFLSLHMVSVYSVFNMTVGGVTVLMGIFSSGLSASFGDVIVRKEQAVLQKAYQEFELIYYVLISWAFSCMAVMIMPFIRLYTARVTDTNYDLPVIGFLFVLNGLLASLRNPQGMLLISAGLYRETRWQVTIQALIAVVGGVIFVHFWGLAGILLGSILSSLYRDIEVLFYIPRKLTKLRVRSTLYRMIRVFICFGLIYWPFAQLLPKNCNLKDWLVWAGLTAMYAFFVVIKIIIFPDKQVFLGVLDRMRNLFGKKTLG